MAKKYILEDVPNEVLDQILSLQPKAKNHYFSKLGKEFYPNLVDVIYFLLDCCITRPLFLFYETRDSGKSHFTW